MCLSKVLEKVTKEGKKKRERVGCVQPTPARPGTPDSLVVHWTVFGASRSLPMNQLLSGIDGVVRLKFTGLSGGAPDSPVSHPRRTRRSRETEKAMWLKFTGLSGGAPDCPVSQRSPAPTVGREICGRHVDCSNGQLVHQTVSGAPTGLEEKRSDAPDLEGDRASDMNSGYPGVYRTVRCTTRQKAGIAFQDCL
jgi:hypothetical protein